MTVGLFIPCYIDQCYPVVGMATVRLLEHFDQKIEFPSGQTCCGQPMANTGCTKETQPLAEHFLHVFQQYDYVVAPSGSCVAMIRHHYEHFLQGKPGFAELKNKTFELCEFLTDVLHIEKMEGTFPYQVGLHQSCHGLRELRLGSSSEQSVPTFNKVRSLLASIDGITLSELNRVDECCGFGGTFAVNEEGVSTLMGKDRIADHEQAGTEVLTAVDMSCLMHMEGLIQRVQKEMKVMHIAEVFVSALAENGHLKGKRIPLKSLPSRQG